MNLAPCPSCARHVRANESSMCPFCGASITGVMPVRRVTKLARAAIFGAALLAPAAIGCGGGAASSDTETVVEESPPAEEAPPPEEQPPAEGEDTGGGEDQPAMHTMYGGPPADTFV